MCGIVAYVGQREVIPLLVSGLEKLEYRGYDSAGVAVISGPTFDVTRAEGKLSGLKKLLSSRDEDQTEGIRVGLGHTRWATHGRPSETNAHPHVAGKICVVHNGIIENYTELRSELSAQGCQFESETDTEIVAHLINQYHSTDHDLVESVRLACDRLEGSYALVVSSVDEPQSLVVAKYASPVVIGLADEETFIASDIPAVLDHTRSFTIMEDGEIAVVTSDGVTIEHNRAPVSREPFKVSWDPITAEKGGYRHFLIKEIHEQASCVTETFRGRIKLQESDVFLDDIHLDDETIRSIDRICIVACGTAWHAALILKFYIQKLARISVEVDYASEFRYREPIIDDRTLCIAISQSGETADTLAALERAKELGARTLAICNVVGSTMTRRADDVLYTHAGPEISVASTKAFTTQLCAGYLLALRLASARKTLTSEEMRSYLEDMMHLPSLISKALEHNKAIERIAKEIWEE